MVGLRLVARGACNSYNFCFFLAFLAQKAGSLAPLLLTSSQKEGGTQARLGSPAKEGTLQTPSQDLLIQDTFCVVFFFQLPVCLNTIS